MTSRDITWRHVTGFLSNLYKMFLSFISCLCPNMKSIGWFLKKLWRLTFFQLNMRLPKNNPGLPQTNHLYLFFYVCAWPQIFRKCEKLIFRRIKIGAGLRPAPIFTFSLFYVWGVILPPPNLNRVKKRYLYCWLKTNFLKNIQTIVH